MTGDLDDQAASSLSSLYDRYFKVVPADTAELLDAAHALRYQVYCVEHAFEDPAQQIGEREKDSYDRRAVHAVLIYQPTQQVVGCVRLILPEPTGGICELPICELLDGPSRARLDQCDPARTAEISRYAVSKLFRRRQGERFFPDMQLLAAIPENEARRLVPHISLGLLRGVAKLAANHDIDTVTAAMAPALLRLLTRFGLVFETLGPTIEYHGLRQPCIASCEMLLEGMATRHSEYYQVVDAEYRGKKLSEPT
jgi:N-acyl amino acid synthase of PEP-CTERM/exosortase system